MPTIAFKAPWSRQLQIISAICTLLLLGLPLFLASRAPAAPSTLYSIAIALPPAILALSAFFAIRGYAIKNGNLLILRPGWKTTISLEGLSEAFPDSTAMQGSVRIFGNSGLFGYIGLFQNQKLGRYRAFATDQQKSVVLRLATQTIVITPDKPERAADILRQHCQLQPNPN
ncbi:PH domain-containing protein [Microbulbifer sp. EKSA008]|uniref:PH domain-containing protein n=1 Tax=unclassified Microbulbifer TaxID=2619833 RepID=UPI0024ACC464|nr:PH domain-containing protein [Microbulbifer sp. VAAF005]WHI47860.1 PH domain-containing protein [Microbulbifer sp. VAAF005]WNZ57908.1 PH domain-containing protein [Microbulbifer sp. MKSA007]